MVGGKLLTFARVGQPHTPALARTPPYAFQNQRNKDQWNQWNQWSNKDKEHNQWNQGHNQWNGNQWNGNQWHGNDQWHGNNQWNSNNQWHGNNQWSGQNAEHNVRAPRVYDVPHADFRRAAACPVVSVANAPLTLTRTYIAPSSRAQNPFNGRRGD